LTVRLALPLPTIENDWEGRAACRGRDPVLFFGPNRFEPKRERLAREEAARAVCRSCPVMVPCREYAVSSGEAFGVWGGLAETDRRELTHPRTPRRKAG
jgi:WhiB family redox-sensing transcriptional regulator